MNILDPQGPIAAANKTILIDSIAIMLAIVIPTIIAIFLLGGVAWIGSHQLDPARPVPGTGQNVTIQVVSLDWKWLFIYPDQRIASLNTLTVPVGAPLHFQLTSASVMNVFFIPQLGSMIYTMNGMVTQLHLRADEVGSLQGLSAHFSGDGFPSMMFDVHVVSEPEFASFASNTVKSDRVLNSDVYKSELLKQSVPKEQAAYHPGDPELFGAITTQKIPPGPGREPSPKEASNIGTNNVR